jgi:hypothetical protein
MAAPTREASPTGEAGRTGETTRWRLSNEFAAVEVELDKSANSPRLKITDLRTGTVGYLDPLELERLSAARHADLTWIVSPANGFDPDPGH